MQNGRMPPGLPEFTFLGSGITVKLRTVAPMLLDKVRSSVPKPEAPLNEVDYGDGQKRMERNYGDPDYQAALKEAERAAGEKTIRVLFLLGVECDVDTEAVENLRRTMRAFGVELDDDDKWVYLSNICLIDQQDIYNLRDAILRRSQPTEVAIGESLETFRGDVSGS